MCNCSRRSAFRTIMVINNRRRYISICYGYNQLKKVITFSVNVSFFLPTPAVIVIVYIYCLFVSTYYC